MSVRRSCSRGRDGEAGFTLLELLIATTVLAFLSLLLFGGLRFGTRVWEKSETSTAETNRVRAAQLFLSDAITRIYPFFAGQTSSDKHVEFAGEEKQMTFFSPSQSLPGALDLVTVKAVPAKDGLSMVVARKAELEGSRAAVSHHTVIRGLRWLQISYFGAPATSGSALGAQALVTNKAGLGAGAAAAAAAAPQWTSVWEGQKRLPLLIRIRAGVKGKGEWPDLVVSPQTEVDESCVFDQMSKYCQGR